MARVTEVRNMLSGLAGFILIWLLYCIVSIAQFTRGYWCASELELRLEGFDRSVTRKTVVQLRRHCTLIWGRWGEGEKWEGRGV